MGKQAPKTKVGDLVQVADEADRFEVMGKDRSVLIVKSQRTGKKTHLHYGKVERILAPEELATEEPGIADLLHEEVPEGIKRKTLPPPIDLAALRANSQEIWVRRMKFDHAHVIAECWYVVEKGGRQARSFTTYDRSLGRRQKVEKVIRLHALADEADLVRRRKRLEKSGYKRWEGAS